jgi:hypothetical protein
LIDLQPCGLQSNFFFLIQFLYHLINTRT